MTDAPKIPQADPLPADLVKPEDLQPVPPEQMQAAQPAGDAPPMSMGQRAIQSLRAVADTDIRELMSSKRGNKWKALAACLVVPAVIGLVLFVIGGEGSIKDRAQPMFGSPISMAETICNKIVRDAEELKKIKAELANPKPDASAATSAAKSKEPKGGMPKPPPGARKALMDLK